LKPEASKIKVKLFPVVYRNLLLEKKRTHQISDQAQGEYVFYVDGEAKYYMKLDDATTEIESWAKKNKADFWRVVKRIHRSYDSHITGPPIMSMIFEWNRNPQPEEVELTVIPMKDLWDGLSDVDRIDLLH
jgi:hypothetical protein